jgi:hypothetical protein
VTDIPVLQHRWRESLRYRRWFLTARREHIMRKLEREIVEHGKPQGRTAFKLKDTERQIREFNSLAREAGYQEIR